LSIAENVPPQAIVYVDERAHLPLAALERVISFAPGVNFLGQKLKKGLMRCRGIKLLQPCARNSDLF